MRNSSRTNFWSLNAPIQKIRAFFNDLNFLSITNMCQFNYLTPNIASKNNSFNIKMCVGEVLLKQWKQGNTWFSRTKKKRPLEIEVFFSGNNCKIDLFTLIKNKFNSYEIMQLRLSSPAITIVLLLRNIIPTIFTRKYPGFVINRFNSKMNFV